MNCPDYLLHCLLKLSITAELRVLLGRMSRSLGQSHFCPTWLQIGGSKTPSSGSIICYNISQDSGKHSRLPVYYLIKDMIKDTNEQPEEEIHRARSRRAPSSGAPVPVGLGCVTLLARGCVEALLHCSLGIFIEASS